MQREKETLANLNRKSALLSIFRLISVIVAFIFLWYFLKHRNYIFIGGIGFSVIAFIIMLKIHAVLRWNKKITQARIKINQDETDYLEHGKLSFENGAEFIDHTHFFSYDLDIFGNSSLYQHINRTTTYIGKTTLAKRLVNLLPDSKIIAQQEAINELINKLEWRQNIEAIGLNIKDSKESYQNIIAWSKHQESNISKSVLILTWILPAALWGIIFYEIFWGLNIGLTLINTLFFINLFIVFLFAKRIKAIFFKSENIRKILSRYALILKEIENEKFESTELKNLQSRLSNKRTAGTEIQVLSKLFGQLDSFLNILGAFIINGLTLYHLRVLHKIIRWKSTNAQNIETWLETIGEMETLNSLANFAYNNPEYSFPQINNEQIITFKNLGHPLIKGDIRVHNDISFQENSFIILTGSNMSGKSTFLRTLGVNMLLTRTGSVICAEAANVNPLPLLVSMRVEDSLSNSESYFFAEVSRLQRISKEVKKKKCW